MRTHIRFMAFALVLVAGIFLAACGPLPAGAELKVNPDGKSARVEFSGQVDAIAADQWVIAGQTVVITTQTVIVGNIAVGDTVKVTATVTTDAIITADRIELSVPGQVSTPGGISWRKGPDKGHGLDDSFNVDKIGEFNLVGSVDSITNDQWVIAGLAFAITADTHITGQFSVGDMVHVHAKINPDGTFMAKEIGPVSQGAQTNGELEMTGTVEAIAADQWTISGVAFAIDPSTKIMGTIVVGDRVKVVAQVDAGGSLLAREIRLVDKIVDSPKPKPTKRPESRMEFTGVVSSISTEVWTIDGKTFVINDKTKIDGTIVVGDTVKVEASVNLDGTLIARTIRKIDMTESTPGPYPRNMEFMGVVESISADSLTVNGKTFVITDKTEMRGTIVVGDTVKVEAYMNQDGTLVAREIKEIDMTESTPDRHPSGDKHHRNPGGDRPDDKHPGNDHGRKP